jgi:hypothetical protein
MERRLLDEARDARRREREQLITEVSRLAVHLLKFAVKHEMQGAESVSSSSQR